MSIENQLRIIFYNTFRKEQFELQAGSRPWHILLLLAEGRFECKIEGETFFAEAGDVVCFPKNVYFERVVIEPIRFHQVGFFLPREDPCAANMPKGKLHIPKEEFDKIILALDREACCPMEAGWQFCSHLVSYLLVRNFMDCSRIESKKIKPAGEIAQAVQYLTDHMAEKINMENVAKQLHLSYTGFLWKFRKEMGCAPSEYLIRIRMQLAKQLLLDSDLRINEIAPLCGYSNAYYFSAAFHKEIGMAPINYREPKGLNQ